MSDRLAQLLAHPLRDRVLREYQLGPACPSEIARRLERPLNLVSYHTRVLARHECLDLVRMVRRRGALTHYYRATIPQFIDDRDWASLSSGRRRQLTLETLRLAVGEARQATLDGGFDGLHWHVSRSPVELDDQAVIAVSELLRRTLEEVTAIANAARARAGTHRPYRVVLLGFNAREP